MNKTILTFGVIGGIVVSALMLLGIYLADNGYLSFGASEVLGYASMLLALSTVYVGVKKHRDESLGGKISFSKAFQLGILITLIAALFYVATWYIFSDTESARAMMDEYFQSAISDLEASGASAEEIRAKKAALQEAAENYQKPLFKIGITMMEILPVGFLVSIISAYLLRTR